MENIFKNKMILIIIVIVLGLFVIFFSSDDIIDIRPISLEILIVCATLAITIITTLPTFMGAKVEDNNKDSAKENRNSTIANIKCFLIFLSLDLFILILLEFLKNCISDYDLKCRITNILGGSFFAFYLFTIISLFALFYNLIKFLDEIQGK